MTHAKYILFPSNIKCAPWCPRELRHPQRGCRIKPSARCQPGLRTHDVLCMTMPPQSLWCIWYGVRCWECPRGLRGQRAHCGFAAPAHSLFWCDKLWSSASVLTWTVPGPGFLLQSQPECEALGMSESSSSCTRTNKCRTWHRDLESIRNMHHGRS